MCCCTNSTHVLLVDVRIYYITTGGQVSLTRPRLSDLAHSEAALLWRGSRLLPTRAHRDCSTHLQGTVKQTLNRTERGKEGCCTKSDVGFVSEAIVCRLLVLFHTKYIQ